MGASIHLAPDIPNPGNNDDPLATPVTFSQGQHSVAYFSKDQLDLEQTFGPVASRVTFGNGKNGGAHVMYLQKLYKMLEDGPFPLDTSGYVAGTPCLGDAECQLTCLEEVCASAEKGAHGASCFRDSDCQSNRCNWDIEGFKCLDRLENGEGCVPGADQCKSGKCSWVFSWSGVGFKCAASAATGADGGKVQTVS